MDGAGLCAVCWTRQCCARLKRATALLLQKLPPGRASPANTSPSLALDLSLARYNNYAAPHFPHAAQSSPPTPSHACKPLVRPRRHEQPSLHAAVLHQVLPGLAPRQGVGMANNPQAAAGAGERHVHASHIRQEADAAGAAGACAARAGCTGAALWQRCGGVVGWWRGARIFKRGTVPVRTQRAQKAPSACEQRPLAAWRAALCALCTPILHQRAWLLEPGGSA